MSDVNLPAVNSPAFNLPELGASLKTNPQVTGQQTGFRVWAPRANQVVLEILTLAAGEATKQGLAKHDLTSLASCSVIRHAMQRADDGTFWIEIADAPAGTLYQFSIDGSPRSARPSIFVSTVWRAWSLASSRPRGLSMARPTMAGCR